MLFDVALLKAVRTTGDHKGLVAGSKKLFGGLCIPSVLINGSYPAKGPLLIIANHNGVFDIHVLIQTIKRSDYKFMALNLYHFFGNSVSERLIAIYRNIPLLHRLYEFPLQYEVTRTFPQIYSPNEARMNNRKSISEGAKWVSQGGALSIFPTGSVGTAKNGYQWKPGVGHLAKQITNPQTQVVFAHITGTRKTDVFAYLHPLLREILFQPRALKVTFSKPLLLSDLVNQNEGGREIAQKLEGEYMRLFAHSK